MHNRPKAANTEYEKSLDFLAVGVGILVMAIVGPSVELIPVKIV
jgi:hypothetical protein